MPRNSKVVDLSTFVKDDAAPLSTRCADFLHWLCQKRPEVFVAPNIAVKAIMGYGHTPRLKSDEVDKLRSKYGTIRKVLRAKYNRDLIVEAGAGIRASVDDADVLVSSLPKFVKKLDSARSAVIQADNLIDMKKVPNTPELAAHRAWHDKQVKPLNKLLISPAFEAMLMLPSGDSDGKP